MNQRVSTNLTFIHFIMISTVTTPVSISLKGEETNGSVEGKRQRVLPVLSRSEVATRICAGQALVLKNDLVLNVTSWAATHPGGALALLHFVGRDAADEISAYHSDATVQYMSKFAIARVEFDEQLGWEPLTPPIQLGLVRHPDGIKGHWKREGHVRAAKDLLEDGEPQDVVIISPDMLEPPHIAGIDRLKERARSNAYHDLKAKVVDAGLFVPPGPLSGYGKDIVRYGLLFTTAFGLFFFTSGWVGQMISATCLGLLWQQLTCESKDIRR